MENSIWSTLSAINCNDHVEKKGKFDYLAWTWAWAKVKEIYPLAQYKLLKDKYYSDGTMEVRVEVIIPYDLGEDKCAGCLAHTMWLPVTDYNNKPINSPNAFDINTARMRCLVKCLAMFGLGHYIYAGESAPQEPPIEVTPEQKQMYLNLMAAGDGWGLKKFANEVGGEVMNVLFNDAPHGQKTKQKDLCRQLIVEINSSLKSTLSSIDQELNDADKNNDEKASSVVEIFSELNPIEYDFVVAGLDEVQMTAIGELGITVTDPSGWTWAGQKHED